MLQGLIIMNSTLFAETFTSFYSKSIETDFIIVLLKLALIV